LSFESEKRLTINKSWDDWFRIFNYEWKELFEEDLIKEIYYDNRWQSLYFWIKVENKFKLIRREDWNIVFETEFEKDFSRLFSSTWENFIKEKDWKIYLTEMHENDLEILPKEKNFFKYSVKK
jgi:hypothetical protein